MLVLQVTYDLLNQILLLFHKLANYTPQLKSWIEVTWGLFPRIKPTSKYMTVQKCFLIGINKILNGVNYQFKVIY